MPDSLPSLSVIMACRPDQAVVLAADAARRFDYPKHKLEIILARGSQPLWGGWFDRWIGTVTSAWRTKATRLAAGVVEERVGSYTFNGWFGVRTWETIQGFATDADIDNPSGTPVFGDGVDGFGPRMTADVRSPWNLADTRSGNGYFAIPRHGSRPAGSFPDEEISPEQKLSGAINMSFYDGHVEQVPLERLWVLPWHKGYVPLAKRPGF